MRVSAPLLLASIGALVSEYAGAMAIFPEGAINLSAFLFVVFITYTKNAFWAFFLSVCCSCLPVFLLALYAEKRRADIFLLGLAFNLFSAGITSILSSFLFGTNGVVEMPAAFEMPASLGAVYAASAWLLAVVFIVLFEKSALGLKIKFAGSGADALRINGISVSKLRICSWLFAAFFSSAAGVIMALRLQAFVPNISSGKGWLALVAVFLGKKNFAGVIAAVLLFSALELAGISLQGLLGISPTVLLSLPYIVVLVVFVIIPSGKK